MISRDSGCTHGKPTKSRKSDDLSGAGVVLGYGEDFGFQNREGPPQGAAQVPSQSFNSPILDLWKHSQYCPSALVELANPAHGTPYDFCSRPIGPYSHPSVLSP